MNRVQERGAADHRPPGVSIDVIVNNKTYVTQNGRPVRETKAYPHILDRQAQKGVVFEMRANGHKDSRRNYPKRKMNISALEEIIDNKEKLFDGFAWIADNYFDGEIPQSFSIAQVHEMAVIGIWLPNYLVLRAENSLTPAQLPDVVGDIYKSSEGIRATGQLLKNMRKESEPATADFLYSFANEPRINDVPLLVGEGDTLCPAPKDLILDSIDAFLFPHDGDAKKSQLNQYISSEEFPLLKVFSNTTEAFFVYTELNQERRKRLTKIKDRSRELGYPPSDDYVVGITKEIQMLTTELRDKRREAQRECNKLLGRDPSRMM